MAEAAAKTMPSGLAMGIGTGRRNGGQKSAAAPGSRSDSALTKQGEITEMVSYFSSYCPSAQVSGAEGIYTPVLPFVYTTSGGR